MKKGEDSIIDDFTDPLTLRSFESELQERVNSILKRDCIFGDYMVNEAQKHKFYIDPENNKMYLQRVPYDTGDGKLKYTDTWEEVNLAEIFANRDKIMRYITKALPKEKPFCSLAKMYYSGNVSSLLEKLDSVLQDVFFRIITDIAKRPELNLDKKTIDAVIEGIPSHIEEEQGSLPIRSMSDHIWKAVSRLPSDLPKGRIRPKIIDDTVVFSKKCFTLGGNPAPKPSTKKPSFADTARDLFTAYDGEFIKIKDDSIIFLGIAIEKPNPKKEEFIIGVNGQSYLASEKSFSDLAAKIILDHTVYTNTPITESRHLKRMDDKEMEYVKPDPSKEKDLPKSQDEVTAKKSESEASSGLADKISNLMQPQVQNKQPTETKKEREEREKREKEEIEQENKKKAEREKKEAEIAREKNLYNKYKLKNRKYNGAALGDYKADGTDSVQVATIAGLLGAAEEIRLFKDQLSVVVTSPKNSKNKITLNIDLNNNLLTRVTSVGEVPLQEYPGKHVSDFSILHYHANTSALDREYQAMKDDILRLAESKGPMSVFQALKHLVGNEKIDTIITKYKISTKQSRMLTTKWSPVRTNYDTMLFVSDPARRAKDLIDSINDTSHLAQKNITGFFRDNYDKMRELTSLGAGCEVHIRDFFGPYEKYFDKTLSGIKTPYGLIPAQLIAGFRDAQSVLCSAIMETQQNGKHGLFVGATGMGKSVLFANMPGVIVDCSKVDEQGLRSSSSNQVINISNKLPKMIKNMQDLREEIKKTQQKEAASVQENINEYKEKLKRLDERADRATKAEQWLEEALAPNNKELERLKGELEDEQNRLQKNMDKEIEQEEERCKEKYKHFPEAPREKRIKKDMEEKTTSLQKAMKESLRVITENIEKQEEEIKKKTRLATSKYGKTGTVKEIGVLKRYEEICLSSAESKLEEILNPKKKKSLAKFIKIAQEAGYSDLMALLSQIVPGIRDKMGDKALSATIISNIAEMTEEEFAVFNANLKQLNQICQDLFATPEQSFKINIVLEEGHKLLGAENKKADMEKSFEELLWDARQIASKNNSTAIEKSEHARTWQLLYKIYPDRTKEILTKNEVSVAKFKEAMTMLGAKGKSGLADKHTRSLVFSFIWDKCNKISLGAKRPSENKALVGGLPGRVRELQKYTTLFALSATLPPPEFLKKYDLLPEANMFDPVLPSILQTRKTDFYRMDNYSPENVILKSYSMPNAFGSCSLILTENEEQREGVAEVFKQIVSRRKLEDITPPEVSKTIIKLLKYTLLNKANSFQESKTLSPIEAQNKVDVIAQKIVKIDEIAEDLLLDRKGRLSEKEEADVVKLASEGLEIETQQTNTQAFFREMFLARNKRTFINTAKLNLLSLALNKDINSTSSSASEHTVFGKAELKPVPATFCVQIALRPVCAKMCGVLLSIEASIIES